MAPILDFFARYTNTFLDKPTLFGFFIVLFALFFFFSSLGKRENSNFALLDTKCYTSEVKDLKKDRKLNHSNMNDIPNSHT